MLDVTELCPSFLGRSPASSSGPQLKYVQFGLSEAGIHVDHTSVPGNSGHNLQLDFRIVIVASPDEDLGEYSN